MLLYVGLRGFITGNEFWDRFLLLFASPAEFPADRPYSTVPWRYLHMYTLIQMLCFGCAEWWHYLAFARAFSLHVSLCLSVSV